MYHYLISLSILLFSIVLNVQSQVVNDNDYTSLYIFNADRNNGFEVKASIVALFTAGSADRNGFRLGG